MPKLIRGIATMVLLAVFVACSGGGLIPTVEAGEETATPVDPEGEPKPTEITITTVILYPNSTTRAIPEVTVTCLEGCEGQQTEDTDSQGAVTFTGVAPLTIRAEKSGYLPAEWVVSDGYLVAMGNEWPPEAEEAVRQLGLADVIAAGNLLLVWGDDYYLPIILVEERGFGASGQFGCSTINGRQIPVIVVRRHQENEWGRFNVIKTAAHEAMHAWQGRMSINPPCSVSDGWPQSESGLAWVAAMEKDFSEVGPIANFDDREEVNTGKPLSQIPWENQASMYGWWYVGSKWFLSMERRVGRDELSQLAPNRIRYLEDYFGPPPPAMTPPPREEPLPPP